MRLCDLHTVYIYIYAWPLYIKDVKSAFHFNPYMLNQKKKFWPPTNQILPKMDTDTKLQIIYKQKCS